ncbi:insulinase family protein [Nitrincola schmidtii]|uniref:insulinase family protein n=1 Tax=Nitrincola schmidtii TaxID=1730894 RepID=UPI00124C8AC1|nr:insulinase family protein [Nitrincola schmidtii]
MSVVSGRKSIQLMFIVVILLLLPSISMAKVIQSPFDQREFRALTLPNQLKVLLISDPTAEKAAASMDVAVGSGANPESIPGLAHFLEHMLFLGTEKFPEADSYQSFINANGGSFNAFTAYENTNYFFDIRPQALPGALDRFSRFFIDPLFSPEYVDRERHAVESEFQARRRDDRRRAHEVTKQVMNPEHAWSRFAVGDLRSLSNTDDQSIRDALIDLYYQYYSANLMSLVVSGPQSLDELQELVEMRFSEIANFNASAFADEVALFTEGTLPLELEIQTLRQQRNVSLLFPIDPIREDWRSKPLYFIASLIGYEGEGSLFSILKEAELANGLSAFTAIDLPNQAAFQISIDLTEAGLEQVDSIIEQVFAYIALLKNEGIDANLYEEIRQLADLEFKFRDQPPAIREVMILAQLQQVYPAEYLLKAPYLLDSFEADLIGQYLEQLNPNNLLVSIQHPDVDAEQVEARYNAGFRFAPITAERIALWLQPQAHEGMTLRSLNPFIPNSIELVEREANASELPVTLIQEPGFTLWFQQDQQFLRPRADIFVAIMTHLAMASPENAVMLDLYSRVLNDQLNPVLYDASLAGLNVSIYPHLRGISMQLSGYNDKQPLMLETLLETLRTPDVTASRFERVKVQLQEQLINQRQEGPYQLAMQQLFTSLMSRWSTEDRLAVLETITPEQLQQFLSELFVETEVRVLAHGNLTAETASEMSQRVQSILLSDTHAVTGIHVPVVDIPTDERLTDTLLLEHPDATLVRYLQGSDRSLEQRARVALLNEVISTPFYSQLRTQRQLGYIVFANYLPMGDVPGIALIVQSPVTHPIQLEEYYDQFIEQTHADLEALSDEQLDEFRQGLQSRLLQPDMRLSERSQRYWRELDRDNEFTTHQLLADQVAQVTSADLIEQLELLTQRQYQIRSFGGFLPEFEESVDAPDLSGSERLIQQRSDSRFH